MAVVVMPGFHRLNYSVACFAIFLLGCLFSKDAFIQCVPLLYIHVVPDCPVLKFCFIFFSLFKIKWT